MATPDPTSGQGADRIAKLRELGSALLGLIHTRVELLALELGEEKERLQGLVVPAVLAVLFLFLALQLVALVVIAAFWDSHRILAVTGVTGTYIGIAIGALLVLRHRWSRGGAPFSATLGELKKDLEALGVRDD